MRIWPEEGDEALLEPHVKPFDSTSRAMKGWGLISPDRIQNDAALNGWVQRAVRGNQVTLPS